MTRAEQHSPRCFPAAVGVRVHTQHVAGHMMPAHDKHDHDRRPARKFDAELAL